MIIAIVVLLALAVLALFSLVSKVDALTSEIRESETRRVTSTLFNNRPQGDHD